jgi:hypothetical protein
MTSAEINALPNRVRSYIAALETECDPAGTVRENFRLREENAGLRKECVNLDRKSKTMRNLLVLAVVFILIALLQFQPWR